MRHGFRWVAALVVLALMVPAAAGALPSARAGIGGNGWNPWSRIVAFVSSLFGASAGEAKVLPKTDTGCGIDGLGAPKCDS